MFQQQKDWETRENAFAAFTMGPLTDFWRQRDEAEFTGVDDIPVRFVRFRAQHHDRVVVICPGRIESYVKYAELAYDLFSRGMLGVLHQTLNGVERKIPLVSYLFANPDSTKGDQVRGIIKTGKLNLATSIETQMTRMARGKNIFPDL